MSGRRKLSACAVGLALIAFPLLSAAATETPALLNRPLCGTAPGKFNAGAKPTLRVATFNVLHGLEETPAYPSHSTFDARLELGVREIARERIDLVGVQEASDTAGAKGHTSGLSPRRMATRLAQVTKVTWHWCWHLSNPHFPAEPDIAEGGGGPISDFIATQASGNYASFKEGSAVLSRYPISAAEGRRLPLRLPIEYVACPPAEVPICNATAILDHRIALWARVDTPGGPTDIIATHLVHGITPFSDASAFVQAGALIELAEEQTLRRGEAARRILVCDCNATPEDQPPVIDLLTTAGWIDTYARLNPRSLCAPPAARSACTSDQDILAPASTATSRIDYVFSQSGTCELKLLRSRKYADRPYRTATHPHLWPSDHQALWTDVSVAGC
jgi:endonuclease/exonuclease/phosphatase family metal-dependent hydrolase